MPLRRTSNHIPSEDLDAPPKQGIVAILTADSHAKAGSIRRTLSADMSSKKWLNQNGFFASPAKKIADEEFNQSPNQDEVWRSIQAEKEEKNLPQTGVWGQILTQKSDGSVVQPPYVHPMVKRSKSSMSEKSLEVCTESLGSETGSDCFSDDEEELMRSREQVVPFADENLNVVVKYKKSPPPPRTFPPPLPSIDGGASVQMHSRRENGRLVLEAVSVAPRNYFHAAREDGRLLLTLKKHAPAEEVAAPPPNAEEREKGVGKEESLVVERNLSMPTGMISVHKSMRKLMTVGNNNINPRCGAATKNAGFIDGTESIVAYRRFSDGTSVVGKVSDVFPTEARQSLPPRPPTPPGAVAASFNAYEYFWRSKPGFMMSSKKMDQDLVLYMRGCKEGRRSLIWEPYCIATS